MSKLVSTIREAVTLAGLKDGMTVSFHHHLRNGDYVLNTWLMTSTWRGEMEALPLKPRLFARAASFTNVFLSF